MSVRWEPRLHLSALCAVLAIGLFANLCHAQCNHSRGSSSTRYSPGLLQQPGLQQLLIQQQLIQQQQQELLLFQQLRQQQMQKAQLQKQVLDLVKQGPEVIRTFLRDPQVEKRLLGAITARKSSPTLSEDLIPLLTDDNSLVRQEARRSLVSLSTWRDGKPSRVRSVDFGPAANAGRAGQKAAVLKWQAWLEKQQPTKTGEQVVDVPPAPGGR